MKLVLFILLNLGFCTIKAQISTALLNEIDSLTELTQWSKALSKTEQYLQLITKETGENDRNYLTGLYMMGFISSRLNDVEKAKNWFDKYLQLSLKLNGVASPNYARALNNAGIFNARHNKNKEAVELYLKSLAITEKASADSGLDHSGTLRNLGLAYLQLKEYEKAEAVFKRSADLRKAKPGEQTWEHEEVLYDLAELYYTTGKYQAALPILEKAGSIIKQLAGEASGSYAFYLNFVGDIYLKLSDKKQAEINYKESIRLYKEKYGTDNADYAVLLHDLAVLYSGMYDLKAEGLLKETLAIRKKIIGEEQPEYLESLNALGNIYVDQKRFSEALNVYEEGTSIAKKMYGAESTDYDYFLFNVGYAANMMNNIPKAEAAYNEALVLRKKLYGENSRQYALALNNLGVIKNDLKQYKEAKPLLIQAVKIRKEILGTDHADYWQSVNNLAKSYMNNREPRESENLYLQVHAWYEKNKEANINNYVLSLHRMATLYTDMPGKRLEALAWFAKAMPLMKQVFGEDEMYIDDLAISGNIYKSLGEYAKAETQYQHAIKIMINKPNEKPQFFAKAMNIMGRFYKEYGLYNKADSFFKASSNYIKIAFTENSIPYASALTSEAGLYIAAGEYTKAEPILLQAEAMINNISGKKNLEYFTTLLNLMVVYQKLSQWEKTIEYGSQALDLKSVFGLTDHDLFLQAMVPFLLYNKDYSGVEDMYFSAIKIFSERGDQNNEKFIKLQNDLTEVYLQSAQYTKTEDLLKNILQETVKILKPEHHEYARAVHNEARLLLEQKKYDKAEAGFMKALELRKASLGINHPDYITTLRTLGALYLLKGDWQKGIPVFMNAEKLLQQNLLRNFSVLSEKEKGKAIEELMGFRDIMNLIATEASGNTALTEHNLNATLLIKSLSLAATRTVLNDVRNSNDKDLQQLVKQWQDSKNFLGHQYSLPKDIRIKAIDSLEKKVEGLEKELTRRSAGFRKDQENITVNYKDVQNKMRPDEAIIEFVRFAGLKPGEERYGAYLLRKQDAGAKLITLCLEKDLEKLFATSGKTTTAMVSSFYRGAGADENITVSKGDSLYTLIWKTLEPHLKGIKTISYSPAGKLYTIAFQALPVDSNKVLMDKYSLQQYTSTRLIVARGQQDDITKPKTAALFGDANFDMDVAQIKVPVNKDKISITSYVPANRGGSTTWNRLPGTAEEVKKLRQLFSDNGIDTKTFTQQQSNEESLKGLSSKAPQVLHIATHGFFLPEPKKEAAVTNNVYAMAEDPLFRSGLVMAGANHVWGGKAPVQGIEDGIATAFEISQIDLSGTELVVLSACETALGAVQGSEGVFGLQRGFKMAGAKKMIVSLWQVPDKETAELMTLFYSTWLKGKPLNDAFQYAQSEMRKKYSPFYWAAFVLIE